MFLGRNNSSQSKQPKFPGPRGLVISRDTVGLGRGHLVYSYTSNQSISGIFKLPCVLQAPHGCSTQVMTPRFAPSLVLLGTLSAHQPPLSLWTELGYCLGVHSPPCTTQGNPSYLGAAENPQWRPTPLLEIHLCVDM